MTLQEIIKSLISKGITEYEIALGSGTYPSTINRIKHGVYKKVSFETADGIRAFYKKVKAKKITVENIK